jgi:hypothetical protein
MEITAETFEQLWGTGEYEQFWHGKPSREMKLRGWTDALFNKLLGPALDTCSSYPDDHICSKEALSAGEDSVDFAEHQKVLAKRRRKRERARLKLIKANGYQRSALSEISARFNIIKKEIRMLMKHAESFMRVYPGLLPNAHYWLTGTNACSGFYDGTIPWKALGPGQRKFSRPTLFISTSLGNNKEVRVKITSQGIYLPYEKPIPNKPGRSRTGYKKARDEKPESVIDAFRKAGMQLNGHDCAAIVADFQKHSRKNSARKGTSRKRRRTRVGRL